MKVYCGIFLELSTVTLIIHELWWNLPLNSQKKANLLDRHAYLSQISVDNKIIGVTNGLWERPMRD
jgi:hypothetical protein